MNKHWRTLIIVVISAFFLSAGCLVINTDKELSKSYPGENHLKRTLSTMSLREKVAQMISCRTTGRFFNKDSQAFQELKSLIVDQKIGGFIIFGGEIYETAVLTNSLQELSEIPLLIASDLERGLGNQLDRAVLFPPLMAIGATGSEELAYLMGEITAKEARAVGIHMTYAPVVDVNINPNNPIINTRAFGEDPELVARLASAFIKGCQRNGLIATAKHFPGHGDTSEDSHTMLPVISGDINRLNQIELFPFEKAIEAGVKAIMTAHLHVPALDPEPDLPATLSNKIMTGLLRDKMGFEGLIVTDAMEMGGITTLFSPQEAAIRAIQAGVDMVLLPLETVSVIDALVDAVKDGDISEERIDESVFRILKVKLDLGLFRKKTVNIEHLSFEIGTRKNFKESEKMFEQSLTAVKNDNHLLPLDSNNSKIAVFSLSSDPGGYYMGRPFVNAVQKRAKDAFCFYAEPSTGNSYYEQALERAKEADVVIFGLFSRLRSSKGSVDIDLNHVRLIKTVCELDKPVIVISFGSPYFLKHFPEVETYICAYRYASESQIAAVKALFGEIDITGKLPVSIPEYFLFGHGLTIKKTENN